MSDEIYVPSPWQQRYHATTADEVLGGGAAGPGKTRCLVMDPFQQITIEHARCMKDPRLVAPDESSPLWRMVEENPLHMGSSTGWAVHLRRTIKELKQTMSRSIATFQAIDPGAKFDKTENMWTFSSGYHYQFGHCMNPDDWNLYLGLEITHLAFDELVTFLEEQYDNITQRVRSTDPVLKGMLKVRSMSNPVPQISGNEGYQIDPLWVRKRFVDFNPNGEELQVFQQKLPDGSSIEKTLLFLPARLRDNPNPDFVKEYTAKLMFSKPHIRAAMLHGNWYVTAGSFFGDEWNQSIHVVPPHRIPHSWRRFRSCDWGYKKPGCIHWGALDDDDNMTVERELTFQGQTVKQVAKRVREIEEDLGLWKGKRSLITGPADTQLWEKRGDEGLSKAEEFLAMGVPWVPADKRSRQRNAERIAERLKDHDNGATKPGLVIFDTCKMLVKTLPAIQTDPKNPDNPQDGGDDHWFDCLHGNTLVTTDRGEVPISELTSNDLVLSTDGQMWPCEGGRMVRRGDLLRVTLSNGQELLATPNHLVLTTDGEWKRVDALDSSCYLFRPWTRQSSPSPAKSFPAFATTALGSISGAPVRSGRGANHCTARSGLPQMDLSPTDMMSTTLTATVPTTPCPIWKPSPWQCIEQSTSEPLPPSTARPTSRKHRLEPSRGTKARLAGRGTSRMPTKASPSLGSECIANAPSVAERLSIEATVKMALNYAAQLAKWPAAERPGSTTSGAFALPVGVHSWSTNTRLKPPARGSAVGVLSVHPAASADTWCTTVPTMGAFVASGVVVSNSLAYLCAFASRGSQGIPSLRSDLDYDEDDEDEPESDASNRGRWGYGGA